MNRETFERVMRHIVDSIEQAGYNARAQIKAYILTTDASYITREGKARDYIQKLDMDMIEKYVKK